jgi:Magnesium-protoporphyrin IX methyltransferase C-terminus
MHALGSSCSIACLIRRRHTSSDLHTHVARCTSSALQPILLRATHRVLHTRTECRILWRSKLGAERMRSALQDKADEMIRHLASLSSDRLILSFAPKTLAYSILKRIGELFPGSSKATRAYLHREDDVEAALKAAGFEVVRKEMTATQFYFSRLFEAKRVKNPV